MEIFFGEMPSWEDYNEPSKIDVVVVPAIDGNFDPSTVKMGDFEAQFQAFHSVQNYFLTNELLATEWTMPLTDTLELRTARTDYVNRFCTGLPFYMIRAATPQALMDEADKVI